MNDCKKEMIKELVTAVYDGTPSTTEDGRSNAQLLVDAYELINVVVIRNVNLRYIADRVKENQQNPYAKSFLDMDMHYLNERQIEPLVAAQREIMDVLKWELECANSIRDTIASKGENVDVCGPDDPASRLE